MELLILGEWKFITLLQGVSNPGEIQEELSEQNRALRETRVRNLRDIEELQKRHVSKVVELSRRKLTEDQKHDHGAKSHNSGIAE